nr:MAG TPA: hypothetical protein [Caudoviricetes sp.]
MTINQGLRWCHFLIVISSQRRRLKIPSLFYTHF